MGLTFGYPPSHDPGELVVVAEGNRLEAPPGRRIGPSLLIHAADYNSQRIVNRKLRSPSNGDGPSKARPSEHASRRCDASTFEFGHAASTDPAPANWPLLLVPVDPMVPL